YYIYLRQCVKPSDSGADCANFYTWEGSDETGFQLRAHNLQQDDDTDDIDFPDYIFPVTSYPNDPIVTQDDSGECDEAIYNLPATDPAYNSDCREFYNSGGEISYHLYSRTITCDDNCHPYRRTEKNIDSNLDVDSCKAGGDGGNEYIGTTDDQFEWDSDLEYCYFCKNGGEWSTQHQACLYNAIPGQGISCSSGYNGCREYTGNAGDNMRIILNNDFEGSLQGWIGIDNTTVKLSSAALTAGGESLLATSTDVVTDNSRSASTTVGYLAQTGSSYVLSFLAKSYTADSKGASKIDLIQLDNGAGGKADFATTTISVDWQLYKVNLARLEHDVSDSESLVIKANGDFYIDDIRLTEITDRYYLIKNSWVTPDSCNQDIYENPHPLYMLGCDEYHDRGNSVHYLHNFNQLCQESAVGCEIMIDTHNFTDYNSQTFNAGDPSEVVVPADSFIYAVYDQDKKCNQSDKGCGLFGSPYQYGQQVIYENVYLLNNPDDYNSILCPGDAVGCEEWTSSEGSSYFKDPGDMICDWRQGYQESWSWWKKKIKRCDENGDGIINFGSELSVCIDDSDCAQESCILDDNDYICPAFNLKTFGYGGQGNIVNQPNQDLEGYWIGICPASEAGCSEYIDPVSKFSSNIIFNADFSQDVDDDTVPDGWSASKEQNIALEPNTLYILAVEGDNEATVAGISDVFYELDNNNILSGPVDAITATSSAGSRASKHFYATTTVLGIVSVNDIVVSNGSKIELKKAVIDYQLRQDLDKTTCNGIVDFEQGCVLFNERAQNGSYPASLIWDADLTIKDGSGMHPETGTESERDANALIKVTPDRVCNKWLACRSYIKDENDNNVCFDIGLCDSVDDNGNCNNFVITNPVNQTYPNLISADLAGSMSGYVKAGYNSSSLNADYYPLGAMEQIGEVANAPNGGFEWAGSNYYPIGWIWEDSLGQQQSWNPATFKVIDNPIEAQEEGIGYAPEGRNFLKLGSTYSATSEFIDVEPGMEYILTVYMNTKKLTVGTSTVDIRQFDTSGRELTSMLDNVLKQLGGKDWEFKLAKFETNIQADKIKIVLQADNDPIEDITGNFYFDSVKLRPGLNSKNNWHTPQTCRLYPEDDALSCNYYEDSGKYQKGWLGYCLEYDRYPGSDDACVLWWPVDKVKGEGIEEGAGYIGKAPVYYCAEAEAFCDGSDAKLMCTRLVQTVNSVGSNKYWSGRVYEGSNYEIPFAEEGDNKYINWGVTKGGKEDIILNYIRDSEPFGSMYPPFPVNNPYEWDGEKNTESDVNIQPLCAIYPETSGGKARAGTPYYIKNNIECFGKSESKTQCNCPSCSDWMDLGQWDDCRVTSSYGGQCYTQHDDDYNWEWQICDICANKDCDNCTVSCYNQTGGNMAGNINEAKEGVKRIFAQSYGAWKWQEQGTCMYCPGAPDCIDGNPCEYDDCPGGSCVSSAPNEVCSNSDNDGQLCDVADCGLLNCEAEYAETIVGYQCGGTGFTCCESGIVDEVIDVVCAGGQPCGLSADDNKYHCNGDASNLLCCPPPFDPSCYMCNGGENNGAIVETSDCAPLTCDSVSAFAFTGNYTCGGVEGDDLCCLGASPVCGVNDICDAGSDNAGRLCTVDNCPGGTCNIEGTGYIIDDDQGWGPPTNLCYADATDTVIPICSQTEGENIRPDYPCDYCAVKPRVENINVDKTVIQNNDFINLTFNSNVDSQQLPLVMYAIDWGDNESTVVTGVEMYARPDTDDPDTPDIDENNPHSLYHLYSYWDLKAKAASGVSSIQCCDDCDDSVAPCNYGVSGACCAIQPSVKIKDNWGWCNNWEVSGSPCPAGGYKAFGGWVVVKEK
ncbi:MAG: hypothetical protein U9R14_00005, partial [Patescibacteria group bacterium]|nr:hypothetical protein [Patescibacteria group bacterium]